MRCTVHIILSVRPPPGDYFYCFIVRMMRQIPDIMTYKPNVKLSIKSRQNF
jgi:hypothetical protein